MLLRDTFAGIDDTLDFSDLAEKLIARLVPAFCTSAELLVLESLVGDNEMPDDGPDGTAALRRLSVVNDQQNLAWLAAFPIGEILRYPEASPYARCLASGQPVLEQALTADAARKLARVWRRKPVGGLLSDVSMLLLPIVGKDAALGFFCCFRQAGTRRFDRYDMDMGMEFASRAAVFFDNAARYKREHATALMLQRSMLPTGLSAPSSVEVKHRYLPGSELVEVGGDWYESIKLPGARVALVVGDVAGHGVRAAVTMGRLRTAIQTLAMLELPPAESLQQLDELMQTIGEREPHFATCAYAVYDAVTGECELAVAGHLPPLSCTRTAAASYLEVAPSPPLGVGEGTWRPSGHHRRGRQPVRAVHRRPGGVAGTGTSPKGSTGCRARSARARQRRTSRTSARPPWTASTPTRKRDDIAVLIAKLRRIPEDHRHLLDAGARALLGADGAVHDPGPAQALGPRGPDPRHANCWSPSWSPTRSSTPRARSCCG